MAQLIQDIKPRGTDSAYVSAPFDDAKAELESNGYRVISLEENARLRMQEGKDSYVSGNGNWTREGVLYLPDKRIFLTKNSPIMDNAKDATDCHRQGKDFYLTPEQIEKALADSVEIKDRKFPTNRLGENELTVYAFGETAKQYGEFLKKAGIEEMPVWLADVQDKPFARQLWFWVLDGRSGLGGSDRNLLGSSRVRGVRISGAEGTQKNIECYSVNKIADALKKANLSGIEQLLFRELRQ
jgi:hypothetical protein